jgi:citrate lyase beta subunit
VGDLPFADRLHAAEAAAGRRRPMRLQALIETAASVNRVLEIAGVLLAWDSRWRLAAVGLLAADRHRS